MTEEEILLNEQRKKIIASMLRKDSNLGNLDYVKNKIRNTKEQIEPYFLGDPVDLDRPGYLTDEMKKGKKNHFLVYLWKILVL